MKLSECRNPGEIQEVLAKMWADPRNAAILPIIEYWRTNQDILSIYQTLVFKRQFQPKLRSYVETSLNHHPDKQAEFIWMAQQLKS